VTDQNDPTPELLRLLELAAKYPEIGPPLAGLAFKIGQNDLGERLVRLGTGGEAPGLEYYFVTANVARREGRHADALAATLEALRAFRGSTSRADDDGERVLHLLRLGFSTLMFDVKDIAGNPDWVRAVAVELPAIEDEVGTDPLYRTLLAQALWLDDKDRSEAEWERAAGGDEPELTWNARGTWYKEAERDPAKAERAYREGLERAPKSALLRHNIAQILIERAALAETTLDEARRLLRDADENLRGALREDAPKGLRRHVHATRDRLSAVRDSLPPPPRRHDKTAPPAAAAPIEDEPLPSVGDVVTGRVRSLAPYGAFVAIGRHQGLLHVSEIAYENIADPAQVLKVGDEVEVKVLDVQRAEPGKGRPRIGLSRKALLPAPAPSHHPQQRKPQHQGAPVPQRRPPQSQQSYGDRGGGGGGGRRDRAEEADMKRAEKLLQGKLTSLGEMLLAKMKEQGK
jgi:predicted RNA-binding protein with RPS1 domain